MPGRTGVTIRSMRAQPLPSSGLHRYEEFIRAADLIVGVYRLPAGAIDEQRPHSEDEV